MKKFTTAAFAALIALALSMPAWSQTTGQAPTSNSKTTKQDSKTDKKDATTSPKSTKKSKKKKGTTTPSADKSQTPAPTKK